MVRVVVVVIVVMVLNQLFLLTKCPLNLLLTDFSSAVSRHTTRNHEGLVIGAPIREFNISLAARHNMQYMSIVAINNVLAFFGFMYGLSGQSH